MGPHSAQPMRPEARPAPCLAQLWGWVPEISYSAQLQRLQVAPHSAQPPAAYPAQQWYRASATSSLAQRQWPQALRLDFGSTAGVSFCSTAAAGSSAGVFVSCAGRGRGSGGDNSIRWRCAPVPVTWWNQVITLCAILETAGRRALGGVSGCGPCAWADVAANNWRDRKNVAAPNLSTSWSALPQHATMNARLFPGVRPTRSVPACALRFLHQPADLRSTASRELQFLASTCRAHRRANRH